MRRANRRLGTSAVGATTAMATSPPPENAVLHRVALRARYVFPVDQPPIADGVVVTDGERIMHVGRWQARPATLDRVIDLGNAAILPGLVNAHTHLEFSGLAGPFGQPGMKFTDWLREVIAWRRQQGSNSAAAIAAGLDESVRAGVTTLGEIATPPWSPQPFDDSPIDSTIFFELIGLRREVHEERLACVREQVESATDANGPRWRPGISPHAPYSVHPELFGRCIDLARRAPAPLAFHLAESREELQLLTDGTGPFRELLVELDAWDPSAIPRGTRPLDYLKRLVAAPRALIIHGNYLAPDEIDLLATHAATMSLIYCPRTHAYFGHDPYPLARLLQAGANVALGTDSRASNPDLSLLNEMRRVAMAGHVNPETAMALATINGAKALGLADEVGSLSPGKRADLCIVEPASDEPIEPHELWLRGGEILATVIRGKSVHDPRRLWAP